MTTGILLVQHQGFTEPPLPLKTSSDDDHDAFVAPDHGAVPGLDLWIYSISGLTRLIAADAL
jgi:hypothetical protein